MKVFECDKNYGQPPMGDRRARPLRIENRQIYSIVGSIHGNSGNFSDRI
jgi:hypothetical protein